MAVLKPRNRLVYFRVSEDEFQRFMQLCEREGARSISDLARDAMHRLLESANGEESSPRVQLLDKLIAEVSAQLQQLASLERHDTAGRSSHPPSERPESRQLEQGETRSKDGDTTGTVIR